MTTPQIRAALLVLMQHSIVTVKYQQHHRAAARPKSSSNGTTTTTTTMTTANTTTTIYRFHPAKATHILRHATLVEYLRKAGDPTAACVVEELLLAGRLRTVDLTVQAAERAPKSDKYTVRQSVMDALCKLVNAGFIERVPPLKLPPLKLPEEGDEVDDEEMEFGQVPPSQKRVKLDINYSALADKDAYASEDPAVVAL